MKKLKQLKKIEKEARQLDKLIRQAESIKDEYNANKFREMRMMLRMKA